MNIKKFIFLLLPFLVCGSLLAQCPLGDVTFTTQQEVDEFATLYPNCTEIKGNLFIGAEISDITDISALNKIISIRYDLKIINSDNLTSLNGLEGLTSIRYNLEIKNNDNLTDITGLSNLTAVGSANWLGGNFEIKNNDNLTNLDGLENLTSVKYSLEIEDNDNLTNITGLSNLASIGNDLDIEDNNNLINLDGLENITVVNWGLRIYNNINLTNVDGLINLTSVGDGLGIGGNNLTDLSGLTNLTLVEGDLVISDNNLTDLSDLESLTSITGGLSIFGDNLINFSGLESLTSIGFLLIQNDNLINFNGLENVTSIGDFMQIRYNDNLESFSGLTNLNSIGGYIRIENNPNLKSLFAFENLTSIGEFIIIGNNPNLTNLNAFNNLPSIAESLYIGNNNKLVTLNAFENLSSIDGYLNIDNNNNLINLSGLDNLTSIGGRLEIFGNDNLANLNALTSLISINSLKIEDNDDLVNLNGLDNITSIGSYLYIENNYGLMSLSGLQNINHNSIINLKIEGNNQLSDCSLRPICGYLENGGTSDISWNAVGCDSNNEILEDCSLISRIQTNVFYDSNQNEIQDDGEPDYYGTPILIQPTADYYYAQDNGIFYIDPGNYTATLDQANFPNWQLTTDSTSYFVSLAEGEIDTITFGIYPIQQISDIQTIINSSFARCNEVITLDVTTKNLGTTIASGIMWLTIDDAIPAFNFIHQPDTVIADFNTYGWYYTDLYPGQSIIKNVEVTIPGPPDFEVGERLLFGSFSEYTDANGNDTSEGFRYNPEVRCSYDPNDKLVNPNREGDYVLFEEDLIYTVRFQNTGNDVAYDVVIRDTLDANLDVSTFRLLGSSHANRLNTSLSEDGMLTFEFRDIFLPDSTSNFEASQGYVSYLIHTIDGLAEESPVTNSAGIYFDLNPPVITNTTQSIMVSELPTVSTETPDNSFNFDILPNPNTGIFTVQGIPNGTYQVLNTSGQIIRQGDMQNDLLLDISDAARGVYFISVTIDDKTVVRRIVKM